MGTPEPAPMDVRAHTHPGDQAAKRPKRGFFGRESARADATRAGVIPHLKLVDQEAGQDLPQRSDRSDSGHSLLMGSALLDELQGGLEAAASAAEGSDWNEELMTPVEAIKQIVPAKGEAANWIIWSAMTVAGLARAVLVSLGYLVARGADTRIKAGAITGLLVAVIVISWLAGAAA